MPHAQNRSGFQRRFWYSLCIVGQAVGGIQMKLTSKIIAGGAGVLLLAAALHAQVGQGSIRGKVLDREGKPLQGAVLRVESISTHVTDDVKTNRNGEYSIVGLYNGQYKVALLVDGRAVMMKGETAGDAIFVSDGRDSTANFDMRNAPATPPPTPVAPADRAAAADPKKAEAAKKADEEMRASYTAGLAALNAKNYDEAIKLFQAAAEKDQTQPAIFGNLGLALSNAKKYDDAAEAFRKSIALKPEDPAMHSLLSLALANGGKVEDAEKEAQEAGRLDPAMAGQSYYNLGVIFTNRGKMKEAVTEFTKAIEIDPKNAESHYQLGIAYFGATDTIPQAVSALEKYLQLKPDGPNAEAAKQLIEAAKASSPTAYKAPQPEKQQKGKTKN